MVWLKNKTKSVFVNRKTETQKIFLQFQIHYLRNDSVHDKTFRKLHYLIESTWFFEILKQREMYSAFKNFSLEIMQVGVVMVGNNVNMF